MTHPGLPPRVSRPWIAVAGAVWAVASLLAPDPTPLEVDEGTFAGMVTLSTDVMAGRFGPYALGEIDGEAVFIDFAHQANAGRGDVLRVTGRIGGEPGTISGRPYGGVLTVREVTSTEPSANPVHRAGRFVSATVEARLEPFDSGRALLSGFLVGETSHLSEVDIDAMRRSGLAHFVAVSGSNVALFLGLLALAAGPLALGPKRRAVVGLAGLPVYAAATRFEPSVLRASVMAGLALGGRLVGVVLEAWQLLALAVVALLVLDPGLTTNVGFQLSVAATVGVLAGARWPARGKVARALLVTMGAQLAVAPLLLIHFESVPLLSPVVNLIAAPIVAASTIVGAVGVAGLEVLVPVAAWLADLVLALARGASSWPQLSGWDLVGLGAAALLVRLFPSFRGVSAVASAFVLLVALISPGSDLPSAGVVVLDVGQGDAILVHGGEGRFALIDGGPDQAVLISKLHEFGVTSLELVVLTHVHADHATGLAGIADRFEIREVWADTEPHSTPASRELKDTLDSRMIPTVVPGTGTRRTLGAVELVVEGPVRRYASPNDQSIVIAVHGPVRTMLLSGDVETHAQADLEHLRADVLKVPHQGAGTSDARWLQSVGSDVAVISVGPNQFGHPVDWVVDLLEEQGSVFRTDRDGDVIVDLTR